MTYPQDQRPKGTNNKEDKKPVNDQYKVETDAHEVMLATIFCALLIYMITLIA